MLVTEGGTVAAASRLPAPNPFRNGLSPAGSIYPVDSPKAQIGNRSFNRAGRAGNIVKDGISGAIETISPFCGV